MRVRKARRNRLRTTCRLSRVISKRRAESSNNTWGSSILRWPSRWICKIVRRPSPSTLLTIRWFRGQQPTPISTRTILTICRSCTASRRAKWTLRLMMEARSDKCSTRCDSRWAQWSHRATRSCRMWLSHRRTTTSRRRSHTIWRNTKIIKMCSITRAHCPLRWPCTCLPAPQRPTWWCRTRSGTRKALNLAVPARGSGESRWTWAQLKNHWSTDFECDSLLLI